MKITPKSALAPAILSLSLATSQAFADDKPDMQVKPDEDGKITITLDTKKEDKDKKKPEIYEAGFLDLLKDKKDPVEAYKLYEYYQLRTIHLDGSIRSTDDIVAKMKALDKLDPGKPIILRISSPGGWVYAGMEVYNTMMTLTSPTHTVCDGMAASMAAVIFIAGKDRTAMPSCRIMIHEAAAGTSGKTSDMAVALDHFKGLEDQLIEIIAKHSGRDIEDIEKIAKVDYFYEPKDALRLGFVDNLADIVHGPDISKASEPVPADLKPAYLIHQRTLRDAPKLSQ